MGGHGGLNILPQKKWNVYNYDNRQIVQKDKKLHAQKLQKKYQEDRKKNIANKFDVLKADSGYLNKIQDQFRQNYQKDSVLNLEFKRLAEENQHINLFENEQKILQNREALEHRKLMQAQWLKDKGLDYSSKFLGTYNEDSKLPWYAKVSNLKKEQNNVKTQRYDMEDLVEKIKQENLRSKNHRFRDRFNGQIECKIKQNRNNRTQNHDQGLVKMQSYSDQQRSRDIKYEFLKSRQTVSNLNNIQAQQSYFCSKFIQSQKEQKKRQTNVKNTNQEISRVNQDQENQKNVQKKKILSKQQEQELQKLREKRLRRQQKQRKKANQLKRKLLELSAND